MVIGFNIWYITNLLRIYKKYSNKRYIASSLKKLAGKVDVIKCRNRSILFGIVSIVLFVISIFLFQLQGLSKTWSFVISLAYFCAVLAFYSLKTPEIHQKGNKEKLKNLLYVLIPIMIVFLGLLWGISKRFKYSLKQEPYFQITMIIGVFCVSLFFMIEYFYIKLKGN